MNEVKHAECMSCGFSAEEAEKMAGLDPALLTWVLALAKQYGVPVIRAALPFILTGDWKGAIMAILAVVFPG